MCIKNSEIQANINKHIIFLNHVYTDQRLFCNPNTKEFDCLKPISFLHAKL
ncbi:hypothetical protein AAJ76_2660002044 [Vairimorpha ceranae]|uniref:Uncharacterized protein n=1 Tax=Vairimorpha ceranae TaxID=40302 RepID=A0A0F9WKU6_9MICR|nr:hypothetical protein AAJ76_2660002044 [Vairimorpha ceranae]KKO73738.1 hypothetical protein AAJ76_2660002044 [Vairimorpha ceranae]